MKGICLPFHFQITTKSNMQFVLSFYECVLPFHLLFTCHHKIFWSIEVGKIL
jgi:hypothetical protein